MPEYIEREAVLARLKFKLETDNTYNHLKYRGLESAMAQVRKAPAADVAPVVHGRWVEADEHHYDLYWHHKCSNCGEYATFDYKYSEDWDEGMDGEWYFNGINDDGINEHLTPYCPHCGARMDGRRNSKTAKDGE